MSCTDGSRPWLPLARGHEWPDTPQGRQRALEGASGLSERIRAQGLGAAPQVQGCRPAKSQQIATFKDLAEAWVNGKLHQQWPDQIAHKKDSHNDELRLNRLCKTIGDVPLDTFSLEDAEHAMKSLPAGLAPATRRHYAQVVSKVLRLAVYPCRLIKHSPLPTGFLPSTKGGSKAYSYLYPSEDAQLLACSHVPFARRLLYGVLAREGCRLGEALSLRWCDLDLERRVIRLDENKTDDPRAWALSPGVAEALAATKPKDVAAETLVFEGIDHPAARFRADLQTAGIDRPELFERSHARRRIRIHDLRATFVTLSLANGRTEAWVCDRTGHRSSIMVNRYRRQARQATELELGPLQPLNLVLSRSPIVSGNCQRMLARVAELADAPDLGSGAARREGSSPFSCTRLESLENCS